MAREAVMAIEAMYAAHGPALLGYLRRAFAARDSAEDLLQETFAQALRRPEECVGADSPRAYLFGIARRVGLAAARRARVRATVALAGDEPAPAAQEDAALEAMRAAIGELPEAMRETLELRLRDGLSYEEIAAVLEIPVGTVRSRLHAALQLLRERLGKEMA